MFTGIVQGIGTVDRVEDRDGVRRLIVGLPAGTEMGLQVGASVSVSGVCLTAVDPGPSCSFDCIDETLERTTLGALEAGDFVNIERSATMGAEIGGHLMSGHVFGVAEVVARDAADDNVVLTLVIPRDLLRYVLVKGFIGLDGCSLTVGLVDAVASTLRVHLIPETLRRTTFGASLVGDRVNIEIDAMTQAVVHTVERVLAARS